MILTLIFSSLFLALMAFFSAFVSGGTILNLLDIPSLVSVLFVFAILIFLTGYGKDFRKIFSSKKEFEKYDLVQIHKIEKVLDVSGKLFLYSSFILPLITFIYLLWNDDKSDLARIHLGPNVAVVLISIVYLCFLEMVIHCLKLKVRKQQVLYMAEINEATAKTSEKKVSTTSVIKVLFGIILFVAVICFSALMMDGGFTWGTKKPLLIALMDFPSLIMILAPSLALLAISGNWKEFFGAFKTVFSEKKISVTEKNLFSSAIKNIIAINIYGALYGTFIGFCGILINLEDASYLYSNVAVAILPLLYASIINLVLYLVEIRVNKVSE